MDILTPLPNTPAGCHTKWLWSWMLSVADGSPPPDPVELAQRFDPWILEQVPAEQLIGHFVQLAPMMPRVSQLIEESCCDRRFAALLQLPDGWVRYSCLVGDCDSNQLIAAGYTQAMNPDCYSDRRIKRDGRDVQIRDFGGTGPLMLLWHGSGGDCSCWETLVPYLAGFHVVAHDLPDHGRSTLKVFTTHESLADADAVVAELGTDPPIIVGHSLGGYLGLRYAATRRCVAWIGLDGPLGLVYPWDLGGPGFSATSAQVGREIRAMDVARDLADVKCPALLVLSAIAANPVEECMGPARRELAEHVARHHPQFRIHWVQSGHDAMVFVQPQVIGAAIGEFLSAH